MSVLDIILELIKNVKIGIMRNMEKKKMTTASGRPVADNQNVQTAGRPGPLRLQDPGFLEKH